MAPNKFEEHIKNKLEQRVINPSSGSWDKLTQDLDVHSQKRSYRNFWWLGVAACVVIVMVVYNTIGTQVNEPNNSPVQVVLEDTLIESSQPKRNEVIKNDRPETKVAEETHTLPSKTLNQDKSEFKKEEKLAQNKINPKDKVKEQEIIHDTKVALVKEEKQQPELTVQSQKTYAALDTKETKSTETHLDQEIDDLLLKAEESITKTATNKSGTEINAQGLLDEIEFDLDQSFRDKVFEKLKSSYIKVSTAIANRNN